MSDTNFVFIGTLNEWLNNNYSSNYVIRILESDMNKVNIPVYISTEEEIEIKMLCTKDLSVSIRNGERSVAELKENIIYKVIPSNRKPFYRLTEVIVVAVL
jgi:hypothetical protein